MPEERNFNLSYFVQEHLENLVDEYKENQDNRDKSLENALLRTVGLDKKHKAKISFLYLIFPNEKMDEFMNWTLDFANMEYKEFFLLQDSGRDYSNAEEDNSSRENCESMGEIGRNFIRSRFYRFRCISNVDILFNKVEKMCEESNLSYEELNNRQMILKVPDEDETKNIFYREYFSSNSNFYSREKKEDREMPELWVDYK